MQISTRKLLVAKLKHNIIYYAPAIGWGILIIYFSLLPADKVPSLLKNMWDFSLHSAIYFLLAALVFLAYARYKKVVFNFTIVLYALLLVAVLGGTLELIQENYISHRRGEWFDFLANITGAGLAALAWKLIVRK